MNNDLISREKLRLVIRNIKKKADLFSNDDYRVGYISALSLVEGLLADAPAVDAEPVRHGRWLCGTKAGLDDVYYCSVCGERAIGYGGMFGDYYSVDSDYCPHCGAKMDGGNEE